MRNFSTAFSEHISRPVTTVCTGWKITRTDNFVLGFTDHDADLTIDGVLYQAASGLSPSDAEARLGFALDNSAVSGVLNAETLSAQDLRDGIYDRALVEIAMINWHDPTIYEWVWRGRIGGVSWSGDHFQAELVGQGADLEHSTGRVFSRLCDASFGDERCGVDVQNFPQGTMCPRTFEACCEQFQNSVNFRGFPYLIGDDAVYRAPGEGEIFDGSSRFKS
ncbi:MAG TPA: DUF2163 domain-containing protein [Hellea balneolensis]|uniref:DUF2163 domain-containing protein n=1 Tax=Hellea balneolensis TaxID=287478 RepID=A0A7C5M1X7_9PROT|nr:DUF2163 domain-containing protein [Hellea balneolensis]